MRAIGIDPGNEKSGMVIVSRPDASVLEGSTIDHAFGEEPNEAILPLLANCDLIAIEWVQSMGMAVGKSVFETCLWVGRFAHAARLQNPKARIVLIPRGQIKLHHCGQARAKDGNVAQSLRDKYGEKGTKKEPGFFYGVSKHAWQAFAVLMAEMERAELRVPEFKGTITI